MSFWGAGGGRLLILSLIFFVLSAPTFADGDADEKPGTHEAAPTQLPILNSSDPAKNLTEAPPPVEQQQVRTGNVVSPESLLPHPGEYQLPLSDAVEPLSKPIFPQSLQALISLMLHFAYINYEHLEGAPRYQQPKDIHDREQALRLGINVVVAIFGERRRFSEAFPERKIQSLDEYIGLTEPLGDLTNYRDFVHVLYQYNDLLADSPTSVPRAYEIDFETGESGDFADPHIRQQAESYQTRRMDHLRRLSAKAVGHVVTQAIEPPSPPGGGVENEEIPIMELIFDIQLSLLYHAVEKDVSGSLRKTADVVDGPNSIETPQALKEITGAATGKSYLTRIFRGAAKALDLSKGAITEAEIQQLINQMAHLSPGQLCSIIQTFDDALAKVLKAFGTLGERIANSKELNSLGYGGRRRLADTLSVLFREYPMRMPPEVLKEIIYDLLNQSVGTRDAALVNVLLSHILPMMTNLLQNTSTVPGMDFSERFKKLRSTSSKVSIHTIRRLLARDINHYPVTVHEKPYGAGKVMQAHPGTHEDGTPVVVRVTLPEMDRLIEHEKDILTSDFMVRNLADIYIPDDVPRKIALERMRRWLLAKHQAHIEELDLNATYKNQQEAFERLNGREIVLRGDGQKLGFWRRLGVPNEQRIRLVIRVPKPYEAKPGSTAMIYEEVKNPVAGEDFKKHHPEAAAIAAGELTDLFYDELIFRPIRSLPKAWFNPTRWLWPGNWFGSKRVAGFGNKDPHSGNLLAKDVSERYDDGIPSFEVSLIDWGQALRLPPEDARNLVVLGFGASFNHAGIISKALWNLRNHRGKNKSFGEVRQIIRKVCKEMDKKREVWGPAEWIGYLWSNGSLDFPMTFIGLDDTQGAVMTLRPDLGLTKESLSEALDKLGRRNLGTVLRATAASAPVRFVFSLPRVASTKVKNFVHSCAQHVSEYSSPPSDGRDPMQVE